MELSYLMSKLVEHKGFDLGTNPSGARAAKAHRALSFESPASQDIGSLYAPALQTKTAPNGTAFVWWSIRDSNP